MNEQQPIEMTALMDQMGANLAGIAGPIAQYHAALSATLPAPLVATLVRDWVWMYWHKGMFPDALPDAPMPMGRDNLEGYNHGGDDR